MTRNMKTKEKILLGCLWLMLMLLWFWMGLEVAE